MCAQAGEDGHRRLQLPGYPCQLDDDIDAFTNAKLLAAKDHLPASTEMLRLPRSLAYRCRCQFSLTEEHGRLEYAMWDGPALAVLGTDEFAIAVPSIQRAMKEVIACLRDAAPPVLMTGLQNTSFVSSWDEEQVVLTLTYDRPLEDGWKGAAELLRRRVGLHQVCGRAKKARVATPEEVELTDKVDYIPALPAMTFVRDVDAFAHPNRMAMEAALNWMLEEMKSLPPGSRLLELYSGCGAHTLPMGLSGRFDAILTVELDKRLCAAANANMERHNLHGRVQVLQGDAGHFAKRKAAKSGFRVLLCDPPRCGLDARVLELAMEAMEHVFYVSCSKEAVQRDLARLLPFFDVKASAVTDLFPLTHHVETLLHLVRKEGAPAVTPET